MIKNALTSRDSHIWTLRIVLMASLFINAVAVMGLIAVPGEIKVRIPPDYAAGVVLDQNSYPKSGLYSNTWLIFQSLQTWQSDGGNDYRHNAEAFNCYLNPAMHKWVAQDIERKSRNGELRGRTRQVVLAGKFTEQRVKAVGNGTWLVWLDVLIRDYLSNEKVKETLVRYPLRVTTDSRDCNPLGVAVDGLFGDPRRLDNEGAKAGE